MDSLADHFAGESALSVQVSSQVAKDCMYHYKLVKKIQRRLIAIIKSLPERTKVTTVRTPKECEESLEMRIQASKHSIKKISERLYCERCHNSFRCSDKAMQDWLGGMCAPCEINHDRPTPGNAHFHSCRQSNYSSLS